jgi:hypothetical protein
MQHQVQASKGSAEQLLPVNRGMEAHGTLETQVRAVVQVTMGATSSNVHARSCTKGALTIALGQNEQGQKLKAARSGKAAVRKKAAGQEI